MLCIQCHLEVNEGKRFCAECGAAQFLHCPKCNAASPIGKSFCADCGTSIGGTPSPSHQTASVVVDRTPSTANEAKDVMSGERKVITVLFADIKGSMELIENLDPEDARAIVEPALQLMIDAVLHFGGYVVQTTGDGIFAMFGAPVVHEDHSHRALYAALRMQAELKEYSARISADGHQPVQGRVGVHTGEAVVRPLKLGNGQIEYTPIGHSTSLGARLQTLAPVGSIAASEAIRQLCEGSCEFNDLGLAKVKGVSDLVKVYEVTGLGKQRTRMQRSAGQGFSKFVGRARELDSLRYAAQQAQAGSGQVVAIVAEAGTGKSRLILELMNDIRSTTKVLETSSVSHGKTSYCLPLIELLQSYFGIEAQDNELKRRGKVIGKIENLDPQLKDIQPYLLDLLNLNNEDEPLLQMDERTLQLQTWESLKRLLVRESVNQALTLIFEDLHWIDDQTQEFLNLLAESIGTAKILLIVNYRPEYVHRWNSKSYFTQIRLDPLGDATAKEMLASMLGDNEQLSDLKRLIFEKSSGTPFFMEEMVKALFDDGTLARDGNVVLTKKLDELDIPSSVQAILAARIDRLPAHAKEILQTLSVIGKEFSISLISAVTASSPEKLDKQLKELQLGEFIYEKLISGEKGYIFKSALTQDVAYNTLLIERRKILHEKIGLSIEAVYPISIDDHIAALAYHFGRSNNIDAGMQYLTHSGRQKLMEARKKNELVSHNSLTKSESPEVASVADDQVATLDVLDSIWRYPVKSMAGEKLASVFVSDKGIVGDRVYAFVNEESNRTAVVRKWAESLLNYHPQFASEPGPNLPVPPLRIVMPSGDTLSSVDSDLEEKISTVFERKLKLMTTAPPGLLIEVPVGTLGGALSEVTEFPLAGGAPAGAFFDYGCLHLIASSTLNHFQKMYPKGRFDVRRFRPNLVIHSDSEPFVENSWVGRNIMIGQELILRVSIPCPRCISVTLAQDDLPRDPSILRAIAEQNMCDLGDFGTLPCAGVYAEVIKAGHIQCGDTLRFVD
ncbi:adenylate/guanylate cyclase domain-containing protein [Limnohabitans sp. Rim8]|uniref:AAA family ATPase n=1 Tax=Limnohabitans sp. Rim8 TaxID=1100718 RepID=UPI00262F60B2|nr:adenylate/guanylate cyclase domain-containing protein [Limnohabitans sp. Rim8]